MPFRHAMSWEQSCCHQCNLSTLIQHSSNAREASEPHPPESDVRLYSPGYKGQPTKGVSNESTLSQAATYSQERESSTEWFRALLRVYKVNTLIRGLIDRLIY
jgi:hypothetical protein